MKVYFTFLAPQSYEIDDPQTIKQMITNGINCGTPIDFKDSYGKRVILDPESIADVEFELGEQETIKLDMQKALGNECVI